MFSTKQFRGKALEYANLVGTSTTTSERHEYQQLQRKFSELADNEQWLADNQRQTLHAHTKRQSGSALVAEEEEHILRCLGAALIMQWGALPRKLQRELFDSAGSMGELLDTASLRAQIARFLHKNKSDEDVYHARSTKSLKPHPFLRDDAHPISW